MILRQDQKVAAANRLLNAERLLDQKLAFHHRNPPVTPAVQEFTRLVAVAEVSEQPAHDYPIRRLRQTVEARRSGTCEDRLPDPVQQAGRKAFDIEPEEQHADSRPAIRRVVRHEVRLDPCRRLSYGARR